MFVGVKKIRFEDSIQIRILMPDSIRRSLEKG